eukprot:Gregarina_sp_Poly_1__717@NODE_1170_length_4869_cov_152_708663_g801_i0_p1_GENE_NODE_1170_length_4869_cov_152_708663_g801_i0NODE_1170_length_4869_cov_152_708663_g801_i0_p1_ORF_typecomplete_len445_score97_36_NODE_1170_length_4869_cov_152_708663_g801_i025323866
MKQVDRNIDTSLVAPLVPQSDCDPHPFILQEEAKTEQRTRDLSDLKEKDDCDTESAMIKFETMDANPAVVSAGDSPIQVAVSSELQSGEQAAVTSSDAAVADASVAVQQASEALEEAEKLESMQREKDEALHLAVQENAMALQDNAIADNALELASSLDSDVERNLDVVGREEASEQDSESHSKPVSTIANHEDALQDSVGDIGENPLSFVIERRETRSRRQPTTQTVLEETKDVLREAESLSKVGNEEAINAAEKARESLKLSAEAKRMAEALSRATEEVEERAGAAKAAENKALEIAKKSAHTNEECDEGSLEKASMLAAQADQSLSGLDAAMEAIKGDTIKELNTAIGTKLSAQDVIADADGLHLQAECEKSHQAMAEKTLAMLTDTSIHHIAHPCGMEAAYACDDECMAPPECQAAIAAPIPVDPCEDHMEVVRHVLGTS